jgi:hypothetical protein
MAWSKVHDTFCPSGKACLWEKRKVLSFEPIDELSYQANYDKIEGKEVILFHGTFGENLEGILRDGLDPSRCSDPSFGIGVYMSTCFRLSASFTGGDGAVLMCKVKLGKCKTFTSHDRYGDEYVIYERDRILPVAIMRLTV